jgi:TolB-like protein
MKKATLYLYLLSCLIVPTHANAQGALSQRVDELSQQIAAKMTAKQKTTVAVVEFADLQGNVTDFGRFLAEELITRLYDAGKFRVIERQQLNKIIAEQKLSLTGVVDPASAKQLGKILGVEAIVSGTVTNLAQSVRVNARLISTETGEIFAVASTEIFKDESVTGLLSNGDGMSSGATPKAGQQSTTTSQRVVVDEFVFELNSCKLSNNVMRCYITITNNAPQDRFLTLYTRSRLFDESGTEYIAGNGSLIFGSLTLPYRFSDQLRNNLVSGVPIKVSFKFEEVTSQPVKITLSVECSARENFRVTFRYVQVTR